MGTCLTCGAQRLLPDARFCRHCGTSLQQRRDRAARPREEAPAAGRSRAALFAAVAAVVVVLAGGAGWYQLQQSHAAEARLRQALADAQAKAKLQEEARAAEERKRQAEAAAATAAAAAAAAQAAAAQAEASGLAFPNPAALKVDPAQARAAVGKHPARVGQEAIGAPLRSLAAKDFDKLLAHLQVASDIEATSAGTVWGRGIAPHSGGDQEAAFAIDASGRVFAAILDTSLMPKLTIFGAAHLEELPPELASWVADHRQP